MAAILVAAMTLPLAAPSIPAADAAPTAPTTTVAPTTTTTAAPPTAAQQAFRRSVQQLLSALSSVVSAVKANPLLGPTFAVQGGDPASMIAAAQSDTAGLSSSGLSALQTALATDPSWPQIASTLQTAVSGVKPNVVTPHTAEFAGTFTDTCSTAGSAPEEFNNVYLANQTQSAALAALLAVPGVIAIFPGLDAPFIKPILAVIWGVANGVFLGLSQQLQVGLDCAATAFGNTQAGTFPVDPNNASTVVQGSSEISVQRLTMLASSTQQEIDNVQNTVNAVNGQADTLTTAATALNSTLSATSTVASAVQNNLQVLKTNVGILENTEVTILNKANLEIANLSTLQQLEVRTEIEANLSRPSFDTGAVGLFQLPQAFGGYLETVRAIVTDTINKQTAVGHGSPNAQKDLSAANAAFAAGTYKTAYQLYSKAYTDVTAP